MQHLRWAAFFWLSRNLSRDFILCLLGPSSSAVKIKLKSSLCLIESFFSNLVAAQELSISLSKPRLSRVETPFSIFSTNLMNCWSVVGGFNSSHWLNISETKVFISPYCWSSFFQQPSRVDSFSTLCLSAAFVRHFVFKASILSSSVSYLTCCWNSFLNRRNSVLVPLKVGRGSLSRGAPLVLVLGAALFCSGAGTNLLLYSWPFLMRRDVLFLNFFQASSARSSLSFFTSSSFNFEVSTTSLM